MLAITPPLIAFSFLWIGETRRLTICLLCYVTGKLSSHFKCLTMKPIPPSLYPCLPGTKECSLCHWKPEKLTPILQEPAKTSEVSNSKASGSIGSQDFCGFRGSIINDGFEDSWGAWWRCGKSLLGKPVHTGPNKWGCVIATSNHSGMSTHCRNWAFTSHTERMIGSSPMLTLLTSTTVSWSAHSHNFFYLYRYHNK